jgi:hypothetical protein
LPPLNVVELTHHGEWCQEVASEAAIGEAGLSDDAQRFGRDNAILERAS